MLCQNLLAKHLLRKRLPQKTLQKQKTYSHQPRLRLIRELREQEWMLRLLLQRLRQTQQKLEPNPEPASPAPEALELARGR